MLFRSVAGIPTFRAMVAADVPTLNQNTTGTASNVTGTVAVANGGSGATTAAAARTNFGATTVGSNLFTLTNPSAVTFPRFNADNTVSALDAATFRTAIGAGTSSTTGTVTSVAAGSYLTGGTITTSGTLAVDATSANTASKVVARDASGNFSAGTITASLTGTASYASDAGQVSSTNIGKTGSTGLRAVSSTTDWSNLPIGYSAMFLSGQTATGAPTSNYFFFTKTANRDAGGGWGGIAFDYNGGDFYYGSTTVYSSYATWYKLAKADGSNASGTWGISISGNATTATTASSCSGNAATATTATTATTANALNTSNNYQVNSLGVGTAASGTAGEIRATNNVTAYYSDERLKTRLGGIENALDKLCSLDGFYYEANETAQALGYSVRREVGLSAQQVQAVLPEVVVPAPIDDKYLTIHYDRVIPLLVEAIKELRAEIATLKGQ